MGLFERLFGAKTDRVTRTADGGRYRVGADGHARYTDAQRVAISLAIDLRDSIDHDAIGRPYGPGNGLEDDLRRLRAVAPTEGAVDEVGVVLMTVIGNFVNQGRYTREELLGVMGLRPDGSLVRANKAVAHPALAPFSVYMVDLWSQAVGLGGSGGPAVDEYAQQAYRREQIAAWMAQAHARLDVKGTTSLPSRDALGRS